MQTIEDEYIAEIIYTPHVHSGLSVWGEMVRDLIRSRELIWRLLLRSLSARYRQSVLGYFWAITPAIVTVLVFTYLNRLRILPIGETDIPYPCYVLLGLVVWQLFGSGLVAASQSLVEAGSLVTKINFPKECLVIAAFGQPTFNFFIQAVLVGFVFVWFGVVPAWTVVLVPLVLIPLVLMTLGIGFILALANAALRDVNAAVSVVMTFGMFISPVLYPTPVEWPAVLINYLNPVSPLIIATRDLATRGSLSQADGLLMASLFGLLMFLVGWRFFHFAIQRAVERV